MFGNSNISPYLCISNVGEIPQAEGLIIKNFYKMKNAAYIVGNTYTNDNNDTMTVTAKHRNGTDRGAKTIWHVTITRADGTTEELQKDSEQLKRIFYGIKSYRGTTTGQRVALTAEAIAKKVAGEWQKLSAAMQVCNDFGLSVWTEEEQFIKGRTAYWTAEAVRIEAEKAEKAEQHKAERKRKTEEEKQMLEMFRKMTPEQRAKFLAAE